MWLRVELALALRSNFLKKVTFRIFGREAKGVRSILYLICTCTSGKILRKKEGHWICLASKMNAINSQFRLSITWQAEIQRWRLITAPS